MTVVIQRNSCLGNGGGRRNALRWQGPGCWIQVNASSYLFWPGTYQIYQ